MRVDAAGDDPTIMSAAHDERGRGAALLLEHCSALERLDGDRPSAFERLEGLIGPDLASRLVSALAGDKPMRSERLVSAA